MKTLFLFALSLLAAPQVAKASECVGIEQFGGSGDGITINDSALQAAQEAILPAGGCVAFGPGTYRFQYAVGAVFHKYHKVLKLRGAGPEQTKLFWPGEIIGLVYVFTGRDNAVQIRDLSIVTGIDGSFSNGTAIAIRKDFRKSSATPSIIDNVVFTGDDPEAHAWSNGIEGMGVNQLIVRNSAFFGTAQQHGSGVVLHPTFVNMDLSITNAVAHVENSRFVRTSVGVYTNSGSFKKVVVSGCTFDMGATGIQLREGDPFSGTQPGHLTISNNLFQVTGRGIVAAPSDGKIVISRNEFLPHSGQWALRLERYAEASIVDNMFRGMNYSDTHGIFVGAPNSETAKTEISGNSFIWQALGVELGDQSRRVSLASNKYFATDVPYRDEGCDNSISDKPDPS